MNYAGTDSSIYDLTTYLFKFYKYLLLLLLLLLLLMGAGFHSTKFGFEISEIPRAHFAVHSGCLQTRPKRPHVWLLFL